MQAETLGPVVLEGRNVRLVPLKVEDADPLLAAAQGFDWPWISADLSAVESLKKWMGAALSAQKEGLEYPFGVCLKSENRMIGSTRYMDVQSESKGVEIGGTWYSPSFWGTVVNPECKFLLMKHAFEDWGAIRVMLKTDVMNLQSQRAILKLGAKFEGRLRNHRFRRDGTIRDSMIYSIVNEEWPEVSRTLEDRINGLSKDRFKQGQKVASEGRD